MKRNKLLSFLLSLTLLFTLNGCGQSSQEVITDDDKQSTQEVITDDDKQTEQETCDELTIAITKDENTLSPFTYVSATGLVANRLIYDTLFQIDLNNEVVPWMVEDDYINEDNKVYTLTLKEGQTFHNGDPVNAEAVVFSYTYPGEQTNSHQRKICNKIESVVAVDDLTVKFILKEADINFLKDGFSEMRIICPSIYENVDDATTVMDSIGSGEYILDEYKTGVYYKLHANKNYFRGEPAVKKINMPIIEDGNALQQALLAGEIDATTGTIGIEMVDVFKDKQNIQIYGNAGYAPTLINFNCQRAPFNDSNFRKAVAHAINVEEICSTLYGEYALCGTPGAVRSDLSYAINSSYEFNYDKAIELFEELGFTETNENGYRTNSNNEVLGATIITYANSPSRSRICEMMKEDLAQVGFKLDINSMEMDTADAYIWPDFNVANGRDYDMCTWGWGSAAGNSSTYLIGICDGDFEIGNLNVAGYSNPEFDELVKNTKVENQEDMNALLKQLQEIVAEDMPIITIAYADRIQACNTSKYDGWKSGKGSNVINVYSFLK